MLVQTVKSVNFKLYHCRTCDYARRKKYRVQIFSPVCGKVSRTATVARRVTEQRAGLRCEQLDRAIVTFGISAVGRSRRPLPLGFVQPFGRKQSSPPLEYLETVLRRNNGHG